MINSTIEKQIIVLLKKMNEQQQQELLNFARFLTTTKPVGVPGKDLLKFAGSIPKEDIEEMAKAIEEEFGYQTELEAKELEKSAELYAEIYREDKELQALTKSAWLP
jgi:hypothetical protein